MSRLSKVSHRQAGLERKLAAYALAGGALVGATARDASADLITTPINETIGTGNGQALSYTLSIGSDPIATFAATADYSASPAYAEITVSPAGATSFVYDTSNSYAAALTSGASVSKISPFTSGTTTLASYTTTVSGDFPGVSNAYLGLSFVDPNNPGQVDYGFVGVSVSGTTSASSPSAMATIESFTYDNSGNPVTVGDVAGAPEPSSLGMAALGAVGIGAYLAWRRRRATA